MTWTTWIVAALALLLGGWLTYDGCRALVTGDYVTPKRGRFAGQLGPWARLVAAVGIEPRSIAMKLVHVFVGGAWLVALAGLLLQAGWAHTVLTACAVAALWYLPWGTVIGVVVIALL